MKPIFPFLMLILGCNFLNAQNLIAVEHNGVSAFYTTLDSAVNAAQTGDNVYVPGGSFTLNVPISKGFNLIGVGYNPDSTIGTGFTQIMSSLYSLVSIASGSDNGSMTGIYFNNNSILFGTPNSPNQTINNYTIRRCRMGSVLLALNLGSTSTNIFLDENIIENDLQGYNISNCFFSKNIIGGKIVNFQSGNQFINNIFLSSTSPYLLNNVLNSTFKNNIFFYTDNSSFSNSSNSNTFYNNLFTGNFADFILPGTSIGNLYWIPQSSIFINQSGNVYDFHQNYHLKSTCPGKNYGTDGTDLGVYGTATPWKEGGVPYNPHIQFQSIATQTDGNGNLSVNIKVAAQKN